MNIFSKLFSLFFLLMWLMPLNLLAQELDYTCTNKAYIQLEKIIGVWEVHTKDKTSPGHYEDNKGQSVITPSIEGCSIKESFRGTFRDRPYAREVVMVGQDSTGVEMTTLDSEHRSFSVLNGSIDRDEIVLYWYRNVDVKRLQSKYILTIENPNQFEFSSFLSTDYGATWALTHERKYIRMKIR